MTIRLFLGMWGVMALLFMLPTSAMADDPLSPEQISATMAKVETRIAQLRELTAQIEQAPELDRNTLLYRRDERSFELLVLIPLQMFDFNICLIISIISQLHSFYRLLQKVLMAKGRFPFQISLQNCEFSHIMCHYSYYTLEYRCIS